MASKSSAKLGLTVVGIVAIIGVVIFYVARSAAPREVEADGTIVALDANAGKATVEVAHPKSGELIKINGEVADDTEIFIGDTPATIHDLSVGMKINASGLLYPIEKRIVARRVVAAPLADAEDTDADAEASDAQANTTNAPETAPAGAAS